MAEMGSVTQRERRWALGFGLFVALLTLVPYVVGFARAGSDWVFTGFLFGIDDGNSYIAKMLSGAGGAWLFRTPYTSYPQSGLLFLFLPYLLIGKIAAPPELHLQLVLLFQLFRLAGSVLVVLAVYDFIALFETRPAYRQLGTVLVSFGGGFGWLLILVGQSGWLGSLPLDIISPETFGFLAIFGLPHLAFGRALMLWGLAELLRAGPGAGLRAGIAWLLAGLCNPLSPAIAWVILGVYLLVRFIFPVLRSGEDDRKQYRRALLAGAISAPVVVYSLFASLTDPFFRLWTTQNTITSPHPVHYLVAFGIYLPWAWRGARRLAATGKSIALIPVIWVGLLPILAYAPTNLQRRLPEGLFVALVILVLRGLEKGEGERPPVRWLAPLLPAFLSTLVLLAGGLLAAWTPGQPVYRPAAEVAAFDFLAETASKDAVVLAPMASANALPAFAAVRVVIGHGPETIGFKEILPRVEAFFAGDLQTDQVTELLDEFGVDYVLAPPGSAWETSLDPVFAQTGYSIYRILR